MVKRASALVLAFLLALVLLPETALALGDTYDVATGAEFASAANLALSGDIINLTANVDCNTDAVNIIYGGVQLNCNSHVLTVSGDNFDNYGTITGQVVVSGDRFINQGTITGNVTVLPTASFCALGGTINGNLLVPAGGGTGDCDVAGTVTGNVNVASGSVSVTGGTIQSDLIITGGVLVWWAKGTTGVQPTVNGNISVSNAELKLSTNGSYHSILTVNNGKTLTIGAGSTVTIASGNYIQTELGGSVVNNSANPVPIKLSDGSDYSVAAGETFIDNSLPISITENGTFPVGQAPAVMDVTVASGMAIYFTSANHTDYFTGATLGGTPLSDPANFTGEDGSIILHMNQSYLNTLAPGTHLLRVTTISGYFAEANIVVTVLGDEADVPTTGDSATPLLWVGLSVVAIAGLVVLATQRKRAL